MNKQMEETSAGELIKLIDIIRENESKCIFEFQMHDHADSLVSGATRNIAAQFTDNENAVVIEFGDMVFVLEVNKHKFSKYVEDSEILVAISSDDYSIWVGSNEVPFLKIQKYIGRTKSPQ
ncbi:hypothetical protein D3C75_579130 [compost metagenome]